MGRRPKSPRAKKARQPDPFEVGDELFFSLGNGTVAGEAFYIGHIPGNADLLLLAKAGSVDVEVVATACRPTGYKDPQMGHRLREAHLAKFPKGPT
jgi:hypothetical protein